MEPCGGRVNQGARRAGAMSGIALGDCLLPQPRHDEGYRRTEPD